MSTNPLNFAPRETIRPLLDPTILPDFYSKVGTGDKV